MSKINLFVYGTLKSGFGNNKFFLDGYNGEPAITALEEYDLKSGGFFPAMFDGGKDRVIGELYSDISPDTLERIDGLEGNGYFYERKEIPVRTRGGVRTAWAYIMKNRSENTMFSLETEYSELFGMRGKVFT